MISRNPFAFVVAGTGLLCLSIGVRAAEKINFEDHLTPLLRNECTSCHNPDKKKAGLDLSSYQAMMAGSENGPVVNPGDPDASLLYKVVAHLEDPYMPKGKGKLADKDIDIFKQFIAMGALPNATGKPAVVKAKPKLNLSVASSDSGKPKGPIAVPRDLILEPVVHTTRPGALMCLAASPWAPLVAVGGQHQLLFYSTDTLELLGVIPWTEGDPYTAKFSRNGAVLVVGGGVAAKSGHVVLFDVTTGNKITTVGDEFDVVLAADLSPDQSTVALGGPGKTVKLYATADGQLIKSIKKHTDWITALGFSPDGVLLASGDRAGGLWVWEAKTGNEFYGLSGHKAGITDVCFRGDSNILASASEDGTVILWDMQSGKEVKKIQAHSGGVLSVQFTHDGRLVTTGRDKVVRIWKPDGNGIATTEAFPDIGLHAAFDGDGKRIVAGDWSGAIRVFNATNGKPVGNLTADPAPLADRFQSAQQQVPIAQGAYDKALADFAPVQQAGYQASTDLQAAQLALAESQKTLETAKAFEKVQAENMQSAQAAQKSAEDVLNSKRSEANRLAEVASQAAAARETADRERKAAVEFAASKDHLADTTHRAAEKAKAEAENAPNDQHLASVAADAQSASDRAANELADAQKAVGARTDQLSSLTDAATKAQAASAGAQSDLATARDTLATCRSAFEKLRDDHRATLESINKLQQAIAQAQQAIPQRTQEAKAAAERLEKAKPAVDAAAQHLASAKTEVSKLKAAQFNLGVWSARNDLAAKQAELEKLKQSADDAKAMAEKAAADLAATQKMLAEAPQKLPALQDVLAKSKLSLVEATSARDAANASLAERQALAQQATDLSQKISSVAAKSADDKTLADAAAKAKASLDAMNADLESIKVIVTSKVQAFQMAQANVTAAESALAKLKADVAAGPKSVETLKQAIAAASADLPKRKAAAEESEKTVAAAKAHVDEMMAQYQRLTQEAATTPTANATPRG